MNILLTGSSGFIGHALSEHFTAAGLQVQHAPSLRGQQSLPAVPQGQRLSLIVHAAGSGTVGQVAAHPALELPANHAAVLAVLEHARQHAPEAQIVLLSSAAVYGNAPELAQREDQTRQPVSLYGLAKQQVEALGRFYAEQHGLAVTAIRLFSVYGEGLRKQLLWDAVRKFKAASQGQASFFGTGHELRDWVHVSDVCGFIDALAQRRAVGFSAYNCGTQQGASTAQVLGELASVLGAAEPIFNGVVREGDPRCLLADITRARTELSWLPQVVWHEGVQRYGHWAREVLS